MHCEALAILLTQIVHRSRYSPWTRPVPMGDAGPATRKRRSSGSESLAGAVPAISAPAIGGRLRGLVWRAPFPSMPVRYRRYCPSGWWPPATGEEPAGFALSCGPSGDREVVAARSGRGWRLRATTACGQRLRAVIAGVRGLRVADACGGGLRVAVARGRGLRAAPAEDAADAGRDTRVARFRRQREGGGRPVKPSVGVGSIARGGRSRVRRHLLSAKVPVPPEQDTRPGRDCTEPGRLQRRRVRSGRIASRRVPACAPDASLFITALACGQPDFAVLLTEDRKIWLPIYSITSSARTSIDCGTSMPSALAALRLMVSWNVEGCSTGMSAGLAPRRMRLTMPATRHPRSTWSGP